MNQVEKVLLVHVDQLRAIDSVCTCQILEWLNDVLLGRQPLAHLSVADRIRNDVSALSGAIHIDGSMPDPSLRMKCAIPTRAYISPTKTSGAGTSLPQGRKLGTEPLDLGPQRLNLVEQGRHHGLHVAGEETTVVAPRGHRGAHVLARGHSGPDVAQVAEDVWDGRGRTHGGSVLDAAQKHEGTPTRGALHAHDASRGRRRRHGEVGKTGRRGGRGRRRVGAAHRRARTGQGVGLFGRGATGDRRGRRHGRGSRSRGRGGARGRRGGLGEGHGSNTMVGVG